VTPETTQVEQQSLEARALEKGWGWLLALGVVFIILGIIALGSPYALTLAVDLMLGWIFIICGIISIVSAFFSGNWGKFLLILLSGVIFVIAGILLLANPLKGVLTLALILAAFLLVEGIFKIIYAFQMKSTQNWAWVLVSGIISLILSILIWAQWPESIVIIGLLVGFYILFSGISMVMLSIAARSAAKVS
jgi:uncharacterized membrane protein HdeD (DUF308 family)